MLEDLARRLKRMTAQPPAFDPTTLDDELALRTEWSPARSGGANFRTHELVTVGPSRLEFRATRGALAFYLLFLVVGLGVMLGFGIGGLSHGAPGDWESTLGIVLPALFGSLFAGVGGGMLYFGAAPIVFDTRSGDYWKGRVAPYEAPNRRALKHYTPLDRIHALQIIAEYVSSSDSSYHSYELNLVLDDGTRMNVVDHGNRARLLEDATTLGAFLGKPVWDAT